MNGPRVDSVPSTADDQDRMADADKTPAATEMGGKAQPPVQPQDRKDYRHVGVTEDRSAKGTAAQRSGSRPAG